MNLDCNETNDVMLECENFCGDADSDGFVTNEKWNEWNSVIPQECPWVVSDGDCNDFDLETNPSETEVCDGKDNNCDGKVDEGCPLVDKQDALAILETLSSSDQNDQNELENAVQELKESLGNMHSEGDKKIVWLDTAHLACRHGNKAFDKEKKVVNHLEKISDVTILNDVNEVIEFVMHSDQMLALIAIEEAPDGNDKDKAIDKYNIAESESENRKKIDNYKKAWKHLNKNCEGTPKESCIQEITLESPENDLVNAVGDSIGYPHTVFTDIYDNKVSIQTSCNKCIMEGQIIKGWTIIEIVDDGTLEQKCN